VHRASGRQLLSKAGQRAPVIVVLIVLSVLRTGPDALVVSGGATAAVSLAAWLYLRTASVEIDAATITYRRFGLSTVVLLDGRQRGVLCRLRSGFEHLPTLALRGGDGRRVLVTATWFSEAALLQLAHRCHLVVLPSAQLTTGAQASAAAPGALPIWHSRPMLTTTVVVLVVIAGSVGWALASTGS
jgi:hypothetical protein